MAAEGLVRTDLVVESAQSTSPTTESIDSVSTTAIATKNWQLKRRTPGASEERLIDCN